MKLQIALTAFVVTITASAAVPVRWTVETSRVQPEQIEAYQGEIESWIGAFDWAFKAIAHN